MGRAAWKGAFGHKARLVISSLTVAVSVAFVVATLVFTDTLSAGFSNLFSEAFGGFDLIVRGEVDEELSFVLPAPLDEKLLDTVKDVDGVEQAGTTIVGFLQLVDQNGKAVGGGPPTIGFTWPEVPSATSLKEGRLPAADNEIVVDAATVRRLQAELGDKMQVVGTGAPVDVTLVGTAAFGEGDSAAGTVNVFLTDRAAQELFGMEGMVSTIEVVAERGTDLDDLTGRIQKLLPERVEVVTTQQAAEEQIEGFKEAIGFIRTFVLVFALIALFVGAFVIANTFRITIAHRTRELALLRAIGATVGQVTRLVLVEALIISVIASGFGVLLGIGMASLLRLVLDRVGFPLPGAAALTRGTVLAGVACGVVVTLASALIPARRAGAVPAVAAMREGFVPLPSRHMKRRALLGSVLTGSGLLAVMLGLLVDLPSGWPLRVLGAGAAVFFIGLAVLSPSLAGPLARAVGAPLRRWGRIPGRLGADNVIRNPHRTGATASALIIGVALVGMVTIFAAATRATADRLLTDRFRADLVVGSTSPGSAGVSPELAARLAKLSQVKTTVPLRRNAVKVGEDVRFVTAADPTAITEVIRYDILGGTFADLGGSTVAVSQETADEFGLSVGDKVQLEFARTGKVALEVVSIFHVEGPGSNLFMALDTYNDNFIERLDQSVFVDLADSVSFADGLAAVERVIAQFPGSQVQDQEAFRDQAVASIGVLVNVLYALLAVSIVIALFGVVGTLLLSVIERTREIGLVRAVGMTRRQLRGAVTWESVIISLFGALVGMAAGIGLAWAVITALESELTFILPTGRLLMGLAISAGAGVVAAAYPAWRAGRLNVLTAIAYE